MLEKSSPPVTRPMRGMMMSLTSESTILPNAPPIMMPTARSTTLPLTANSRNSLANDIAGLLLAGGAASDRRFAAFAGADADDLLDRRDEDLAVADLARARCLDDCLDGALDQIVGDDELDLHLWQEVDDILGTAVELRVPLLAAETLDLRHREAADTDLGQRLADLVQLERLDDRFDL